MYSNFEPEFEQKWFDFSQEITITEEAAAAVAEATAVHMAADKIIKIIPADQTGGLIIKLHNRFNTKQKSFTNISKTQNQSCQISTSTTSK